MLPRISIPSAPDLQLSLLSLGTVKWGRNQGLKYGTFELPEDAVLHALLDECLASGINVLDTAPAYGTSETRLGQLLQERGQADQFIVATKTGEVFENGESRFDFSKDGVMRSVESSCKKLRRETLEIVHVHADRDDLRVVRETPVLETLHELRRQGQLKLIGFSATSVPGAMAALDFVDTVMLPFNITFQEYDLAIKEAAARGKAVFIKRALNSGAFPGKADPAALLKPLVARGDITSILIGTVSPVHLRQNVQACLSALAD